MNIVRGDIILVKLESGAGSEQSGNRPALVIQNNFGNKYSPTTIIAPITSKIYMKEYPTNVEIKAGESGLDLDSTVLLNQIRTIDKSRIIRRIGQLDLALMRKVNLAIKASLELD